MLRSIISKAVNRLRRIYHHFFPIPLPPVIHHTYDARELFFQEHSPSGFNRYDMIVRLLAIENYYGKNDYGFEMYRKMQEARHAIGWEGAVDRFRALIKSYEENGYDDASEILLDKNLHLWDGSHRLALAFYYKKFQISCAVDPVTHIVYYGIDWFIEHDFTIDEISRIQAKYEQLKREIQVPFICTLWAPVADYFDEITAKLKLICPVVSVKDYSYDEYSYAQVVRKVYAVDDIEPWKIEKKLEYMRKNVSTERWPVRVVQLQLDTPDFRRKSVNDNLLSRTCEDIKRIIRNCYKGKMPQYFHDIICHIGDNYYQNDFIHKLFNVPSNITSEVLNQLKKYDYTIVKFNAESAPSDFPLHYPLGKDLDIVCTEQNFTDVLSIVEQVLDNCLSNDYSYRRAHVSDCRTQIRVELEGCLLYAYDVYYQSDGIKLSFFEELIKNSQFYNGVKISTNPYELVLRIYEIINHPQKAQHLYYACRNIDALDDKVYSAYLSEPAKEIVSKIKSGEKSADCIVVDKMSWGGVKFK